MLTITPVAYSDPTAQTLVEAVQEEYRSMYGGEGDTTPIDDAEFVPPAGVFLLASDDGPLGMIGLRRRRGPLGELKRMYVRPGARGRGVARRLLAAAEREAEAMGLEELWLETGPLQTPAIALYRSAGYTDIPLFAPYFCWPDSICLGKRLDGAPPACATLEPASAGRTR